MPMGHVPVLEIDGKKYHQSKAIGRYLANKCNLYGSNEIEVLEIDATVDSIDDMRQGKYWIATIIIFAFIIFLTYHLPCRSLSVSYSHFFYDVKISTRIHFAALAKFRLEKNSAIKEKLREIAFGKLPFYLDKFEEQVKGNGGYFVRGKVTICCYYCVCFIIILFLPKWNNTYPPFQLSWADFIYAAYTEYLNASLTMDLNKDHPELKKVVDKVRALPGVKAYLEKRPKVIF